jgi:hypothetical protein
LYFTANTHTASVPLFLSTCLQAYLTVITAANMS